MNALKPPNYNGPEAFPLKAYVKSFKVAVFVIDLKDRDTIIDQYVIDYGKYEDKQWLGKLSYYCWQRGYSVETMSLDSAEGR